MNDADIEMWEAAADSARADANTGYDRLTPAERARVVEAGARSAWYGNSIFHGCQQAYEDMGKHVTNADASDIQWEAGMLFNKWEQDENR